MGEKSSSPEQSKPGFIATLETKYHLPIWFTRSLTDRRQWKNFLRCMIVTLATMVLMLCQSSLNVLGQAAFFGLIISQMLPPYMAMSVYLFALIILLVGLCFGWAWGVAAMAAALRARDQTLYASQLKTQEAGYNTNANIDAQYQASIFHGAFLDPRSSTVFGVFLFVGAYMLGFLRATKPRLTLGCVFGTIILDLMCSFGPLFPIAEYTLARMLLIPAACFMAIALASILIIFPQTLNHIVLDSTVKTAIGPLIAILKLQDQVLNTSPSDHATWTQLAEKAYELRKKHMAGITALGGQMGLLQLEITRGQIGPGDLQKIFDKCKALGARIYGLASFMLIVEEQHQSFTRMKEDPGPHTALAAKQHFERVRKHTPEEHTLDHLLPILEESTAELRSVSIKALEDISSWLFLVNHTRWKKVPASAPPISEREANLAAVQKALVEFRSSKRFALLEPYRDLFDARTGQLRAEVTETYTGRDLFRCFVMTSNLISSSLVLIELLELLLEIERANPKSRIQLPNAFAKMLVKTANAKGAGVGGNPIDMGIDHPDQSEESLADGHDDDASETTTAAEKEITVSKEKKARSFAKDPDAGDPRNAFQRFGRSLATLWKGLTGPSGLFALKYALVSIALWIPAVCPSSAYFVYTNRGLWALIMAQTGLGVFTGEQILSFVVRMAATILGLVMGMVAWYIGAGRGSGNPYGIAAATMVLIAPFLFVRIAAPMDKAMFFIMTGVTLMFVVGYSWVDEHVYQTANQGSGASLAGRRALLVIIGFAAAFLVMLFPKPTSARLLFRRRLAKNMGSVGDLYGKVVTGIESEMDHESAPGELHGDGVLATETEARRERYRGEFLRILGRLMAMEPQLGFAGSEPGLKGPWPKAKYAALFRAQSQVLSTIALLSGAYSRLEVKWCKILAKRSDMMHPAFIADCLSLFSMLQQALRSGEPLPPTIPIFERLMYHHSSAIARGAPRGLGSRKSVDRQGEKGALNHQHSESDGETVSPEFEVGSGTAAVEADAYRLEIEKKQTMELMSHTLTWDTLHDEQIPLFATANIALLHIAVGLNDMYRIVRDLVGEKELQGLDRAAERWARGENGV